MDINRLSDICEKTLLEAKESGNLETLERMMRVMLKIVYMQKSVDSTGSVMINFFSEKEEQIFSYTKLANEIFKVMQRKMHSGITEFTVNYFEGINFKNI